MFLRTGLVAIVCLAFTGCSRVLRALTEDEPYNPNPCETLYHAEVLAENARRFGTLSTWSNPSPLNYQSKVHPFDPSKVDCRGYNAMLGFTELPAVATDAFAVEMARPFFADAASAEVLHLELESILPRKGEIRVAYDIRREDLGARREEPPPPSNESTYELSNVSHFTRHFGGGSKEDGVTLTVGVPHDIVDGETFAARIKTEHASETKGVLEVEVDVIVAAPTCKLCTRKQLHYFFSGT
jgi:hypothetical protein